MISAHTCDLLYSSTSSSQVHLGYFNTPQANLEPLYWSCSLFCGMSSAFWYQVKLKICKNRRSFEDFATGEETGQCCSTNFFNPQASRLVWAVRFFSLLFSFFLYLLIQELLVEHWYSRWWWRHSSGQVMAPAPENQRKCPWQETFSSFNSFPWKSDVRDLNSVEPLLSLPSRTAIKTKVSKSNDISRYSDWICKQSTKKEKRTNRRCIRRFFLF